MVYNVSIFINNLNAAMQKKDMTQADIARALDISRATVSSWLRGQSIPRMDKIDQLCRLFMCSRSDLLEEHVTFEEFPSEDLISFPIVGTISAGYDGQAIEEETGEDELVPARDLHGGQKKDYFVLRVKGMSMYPRFLEGDRVLVKRCTSVDSGSTAVVLFNGNEATIKKVNYVFGEDWMELVPINPEYPVKRIEGAELTQCRVLGRVVELFRHIS